MVKLKNGFEISPVVHGHWRMHSWNMSGNELLSFINQVIELGITTFDHADIYGNYSCEKIFGNMLALDKGMRDKIQIITKCGIMMLSDKFPNRKIPHYDQSYKHIIESVNNSLKNLNTGYIDLLLLHRPSPFYDPEEIAKAFSHLKQSGKVLHFGVSNFNPLQFETLDSFLDEKLVTNQVEISPLCLEHFENGNMDFFLKNKIKPLAWSPVAAGRIMQPRTEKEIRVNKALNEVAAELEAENIDKVIYSWILKHPAGIVPITGSGKISRIKYAVEAMDMDMNLEQWFKIYIAALGEPLP